jgi:nitroimidazol reductase NimA-like FMN-containing flavoprotein (pyridoxamine 5'-phosphate oxidase superfamily)
MDPGTGEFEPLARDACLQLLVAHNLGRVALNLDALPVVVPVGYEVVGNSVIFAIGEGTRVESALRDSVTAFQVDGSDRYDRYHWSVLVTGRVEAIEPSSTYRRAGNWTWPWLTGQSPRYMRMSTEVLFGHCMLSEDNLILSRAAV